MFHVEHIPKFYIFKFDWKKSSDLKIKFSNLLVMFFFLTGRDSYKLWNIMKKKRKRKKTWLFFLIEHDLILDVYDCNLKKTRWKQLKEETGKRSQDEFLPRDGEKDTRKTKKRRGENFKILAKSMKNLKYFLEVFPNKCFQQTFSF